MVIIHNANFDLSFKWRTQEDQETLIEKNLVIDSLEVARNKFIGTSNFGCIVQEI